MNHQASLAMRMAIDQLPQTPLAHFPTPLMAADNLSQHLAGARIFIKRDDMTGFVLGGTKARMLGFHMAVAKRKGCDTVILYASAQSNYCCHVAAAASRLGMKAVLLLGGSEGEEAQGNLLLDRLLGADISFVERIDDPYSVEGIRKFKQMHAATVQHLRSKGHRPMVIDKIHRPSVWSIVGAMTCALELSVQLSDANLSADYLFVTVGSGATYAGLLLAMRASGLGTQVVGVSSMGKREGLHSLIASRAREAARLLGVELDVSSKDVAIHDQYAGSGFGIPTAAGNEAIALVARTEGIFLDPVFTGKGMAALVDQIRHGRIGRDKTVVFLHTGGIPALFAYGSELLAS